MAISVLFIQVLLTIPLTILLNYFDKKIDGLFSRIIIPTLYIIFLSILIPFIKTNIFLIVIFEIFIKNFYITNFSDTKIDLYKVSIVSNLFSIVLSIITYNTFISKFDYLFLSGESLKILIWFLIILYFYDIYTKNSDKIKIIQNKERIIIDKENVLINYTRFKNKYNDYINSKNKRINILLYAIMIYEYNSIPFYIHKFKKIVQKVIQKEKSCGLVCFSSIDYITDEELIKREIMKLELKLKESNKTFNLDFMLNDYEVLARDRIKMLYDEIFNFINK